MSAKLAYEHWLKTWSDIQEHLPRLYEAARGNCVEIGVRAGVSTSALLAGLEEHGGHLTSIDINDCSGAFHGHPQWTFMRGNSLLPTTVFHAIDCLRDFDLAFIDGDHTYSGALSDLKTFGARAQRILVHDTDAPDYPGVRMAVVEFAESSKRKVRFHPGSYGMGEIN